MTTPAINDARVETIVRGRYSDACRAIGESNLATILCAEQQISEAKEILARQGVPHRAYIGLLKLVRERRQRLQREDQQRQQQGRSPATFRL